MKLPVLARALVEAPSPSGEEGPALLVAARFLEERGFKVERQPVGDPSRFNLFAARGRPRAVLSTHLDTVPGFLPVRVEGGRLHGRGACDAKGSAAAMCLAASEAVDCGLDDFGLLLLVGEESTSDGARAANEWIASGAGDWRPSDALLAEPTDNRFVSAHPAILVARIEAEGRSAHSAFPEEGLSAVHALLDSLAALRAGDWPEGTRLNVGTIEGGSVANVLAERAAACLMLRARAPVEELVSRLRAALSPPCRLELRCSSEAVRFEAPALILGAQSSGPVAFGTDAPFLTALGRLFLCGPGSIRLAHSERESVAFDELEQARGIYLAWLRERLSARGEAS